MSGRSASRPRSSDSDISTDQTHASIAIRGGITSSSPITSESSAKVAPSAEMSSELVGASATMVTGGADALVCPPGRRVPAADLSDAVARSLSARSSASTFITRTTWTRPFERAGRSTSSTYSRTALTRAGAPCTISELVRASTTTRSGSDVFASRTKSASIWFAIWPASP